MPNPNPSSTRNVALFLDGTWNTLWDNTNVWRLKSLCKQNSSQLVYYSQGVGTQADEKFRGGVLGYGIDQEVIDAYEWLVENHEEGDHLFLFGFSRGAYTARSLSGLISKCGLLRAGAPLSVRQLYDRYRLDSTVRDIRLLQEAVEKGQKNTLTPEENWMLKYCKAIPIWFLGVWDTVGSLGISFGDIPELSRQSYHFLETDLRINNTNAYHALAIDEHRADFAPTLWSRPKDASWPPARSLEKVEQRWFVGAHANVGGGYRNDLLAQVPLKWLMGKAKGHGLEFRYDVEFDGDIYKAGITDSYADFMDGVYKHLPFTKEYYRVIDGKPLTTSFGDEAETINETIDVSVFNRWRADVKYRPQNLQDWANKHQLDIAKLNSTVWAAKPDISISDSPAPDGDVIKMG